MMQDTVCLDDDLNSPSCAETFDFFAIESETGLGNIDGILGLSPPKEQNGPPYVEQLYSEGKLTH